MKPDTFAILSDPELVAARDKHFARMEDVYAGRDDGPGQCFVLYGESVSIGVEPLADDNVPEKIEAALDELAGRADALRDEKVFRPLILEVGICSVHFLDRMFHKHVLDEGKVWQNMRMKTPIGQLQPPDLKTDPLWALARECAERAVAMNTSVPLMTPPCLSSPLNVMLNLYGADVYFAMLEDPDAVRRDLAVIHELVLTTRQWYIDNVPTRQFQGAAALVRCQPPGYGQIDGCSTQMISPELYADMIAPLDAEILGLYPNGGMIHLCGAHTQHCRTWREMASLRAVQLCAGPNLEVDVYFNELRDDQIIYIGPTKDLSMDRILDVTGGRRIILAEDLPEPLPMRR